MKGNVGTRPFVWDKVFPGIPESPVTAVTVPDNRFTVEGHDLVIIDVGHTDTEQTSVLHVPDLDLVVAGDVIQRGPPTPGRVGRQRAGAVAAGDRPGRGVERPVRRVRPQEAGSR
jgi:hypothetical protein